MDVTLTLSGDQIGTYTGLSNNNQNNDDREVTLDGVQALGSSDDRFTVLVEQTNGADEFQNGQFVTIFDSDGNEVMPRTGINPDAEQGRVSGDEHLVITNQPYVIDLGGLPVGPASVTYTSADDSADAGEGDNDGNLDFNAFPVFPCLAAGTLVETTDGDMRVEDLVAGMQIVADHGSPRTVLWVGQRTLDLTHEETDQRPICFAPGSLGEGKPHRQLIVSPGHRMLIRGAVPEALFGTRSVLAVARGLTELPGVRIMHGKRQITYVSILLDQHAVLKAEGVWTESFYPGPYGMATLDQDMQRQVKAAIPGYDRCGLSAYGLPAYRLLRLQQGRQLARALRRGLHDKNSAASRDISSVEKADAAQIVVERNA